MAPMTSQSDAKANAMRDGIRKAKDTLKASGTTYYVSNTGNDNNSGTSPSHAWATINKVNSWDYSAGDVVLFNRGDIFRGTITAKANLSYGAYGAGDKPAIYGARENAAGAEWKKVSDNIWMINSYVFNDIGNIVFNHGEAVGRKKLQNTLTANYHFYHNKETGQL